MKCPYCFDTNHCVLESRIAEDSTSIRRRRECNKCHKRFTTYERIEGLDIKIMKKNGSIEEFDREKIKRGLLKATWKRPVSLDQINEIIDEVEGKLRLRKSTVVRSYEVGKMVISRLKKLDPLGYLLFASVYRDFEGIDDFEREIQELKLHSPKGYKRSLQRETRHEATA
jgi:transcriptional repressor NrdR